MWGGAVSGQQSAKTRRRLVVSRGGGDPMYRVSTRAGGAVGRVGVGGGCSSACPYEWGGAWRERLWGRSRLVRRSCICADETASLLSQDDVLATEGLRGQVRVSGWSGLTRRRSRDVRSSGGRNGVFRLFRRRSRGVCGRVSGRWGSLRRRSRGWRRCRRIRL